MMHEPQSLNGIISHLTTQYGGNVHEKAIVTITSKSVLAFRDPPPVPQRVSDLTSALYFQSVDESGQWICWDFGDRRVRATHYTIMACGLKSLIVEGSLDCEKWAVLDRHWRNHNFHEWETRSFALKPKEVRLLRLTQTGKNHREMPMKTGTDSLRIQAVEFFGTLFMKDVPYWLDGKRMYRTVSE
jgi:hypothetical protein